MAGLIVLRIERCIEEREVREHALCRYAHGQLEQVVVGLAGVVVDALLDLENMNRENRGFAVAQTGLGCLHQAFHDQTAFGRNVGTVVERSKRYLCACTRVHGIEVVHQCFHSLIGIAAGLLDRVLAGKAHDLGRGALIGVVAQQTLDGLVEAVAVGKDRDLTGLALGVLHNRLAQQLAVLLLEVDLDGLGQVIGECAAEGLLDAGRHGVIEIRDGLAAMLVVLVGLERDARQRRVRADVVRLTQEAVTGRKTALEQLEQVNLAAGGGQGEEIQVVDVDVALAVCACVLRVENEHLVELLRALRAVLEHRTHCGIAVDVGVLALYVVLERGLESQILINFHQTGIHLTHAGALVTVQDVPLCRARMAGFDQNTLDLVLDLLDGRNLAGQRLFQVLLDLACQGLGHLVIVTTRGLRGLKDRVCNFIQFKGRLTAVSFDDLSYHVKRDLLPRFAACV